MTENEIIRENRRAKFLEKLEKKNAAGAFISAGTSVNKNTDKDNNLPNVDISKQQILNEDNKVITNERRKEIVNSNPMIRTQVIKLDNKIRDIKESEEQTRIAQEMEIKENIKSENIGKSSYKEIYNKQKSYEKQKDILLVMRFILFIIFGILHYTRNFADNTHLVSVFIITETCLHFYNKQIDSIKTSYLSSLPNEEPLTKMVQEQQIMDILSLVEKSLGFFTGPFSILLDISTFVFTIILCYLINSDK